MFIKLELLKFLLENLVLFLDLEFDFYFLFLINMKSVFFMKSCLLLIQSKIFVPVSIEIQIKKNKVKQLGYYVSYIIYIYIFLIY